MSMPSTVTLNDGHEMPSVGFGTYKVGRDAVRAAAEAGYRGFDTASVYANEDDVALGIADAGLSREDVHLTSKVWEPDMSFDGAIKSFDASRRRLQTDVIDLYLIHWPRGGDDRIRETWRAFEKLQSDGVVRSIGVSNFETQHLDLIAADFDVVPAVNQIERHPFKRRTELFAENTRRGIVTSGWSPLGLGGPLLEDPTLLSIAEAHGVTAAQVAIRWAVDAGTIPLPRSSKPERIAQNLDIADLHLTVEEIAAIDQISA